MSALFDSNILIDLTKGIQDAKTLIAKTPGPGISRIVWIEVLAGTQPENERQTRALLTLFTIYEVTAEIADRVVRLRQSTRLKLPDAIIYATAQVHGLTLLTRNSRDFSESLPGVQIPYSV